MDRPRGYYAKSNKSDCEGQMSYDMTYMWNVKTKTNKKKQERTHIPFLFLIKKMPCFHPIIKTLFSFLPESVVPQFEFLVSK